MSHYSQFLTKFANKAALVKALDDAGYPPDQVEVHGCPVNLYGYAGDMRDDKAEIVIRRKYVGGASNDLGFALQPDGCYAAIISGFDRYRHDEAWLDKLTQRYAYHATIDTLTAQGFEVGENIVEEDGTIRLTLNVYSLG